MLQRNTLLPLWSLYIFLGQAVMVRCVEDTQGGLEYLALDLVFSAVNGLRNHVYRAL